MRANRMMGGTMKTFARRGELPASVHQCSRYNGVDISKNRKTKRVTNFEGHALYGTWVKGEVLRCPDTSQVVQANDTAEK